MFTPYQVTQLVELEKKKKEEAEAKKGADAKALVDIAIELDTIKTSAGDAATKVDKIADLAKEYPELNFNDIVAADAAVNGKSDAAQDYIASTLWYDADLRAKTVIDRADILYPGLVPKLTPEQKLAAAEENVRGVDQTQFEEGESFISLTQQTHQCILVHYLDAVANFHRGQLSKVSYSMAAGAVNEYLVKTIAPNDASDPARIILIDDSSPDASVAPVNALTSLGRTDVDAITPAQLARLIPSLRLYKIYRENGTEKSKVEFKFSNKTDSGFLAAAAPEQKTGDFIMDAGYAKGKGSGIKSFNWSFVGGDPFTATRDLTATLKIFFQDFRDLTEVRTDSENLFDPDNKTNPEYKYLDLVLQADCRDSEQKTTNNEEAASDVNENYETFNPECYEIVVEVGYAPSPDLPAGLGSQSDTLYLTMVEHSFDIGQDGTFELTIEYRARLASLLGDKGMNVLAPAGGHVVSTFLGPKKGMAFDIREVEKNIQIEEKRRKEDDEHETEELEALKGVKEHLLFLRNNSLYRSISDTLLDNGLTYQIEVPNEVFAKFTNFNKFDRSKKTLIGLDEEGDWDPKTSDIRVAAQEVLALAENTPFEEDQVAGSAIALEQTSVLAGMNSSWTGVNAGAERFGRTFLKENIYFTTIGNILAVVLQHVTGKGSFDQFSTAGDLEDLKEAFKQAGKEGASEEAKEAAPLTEAPTGGVYITPKTKPAEATDVSMDPASEELLKRFRVILGAATYVDVRTGIEKTINLAHLPVSMQMFRKFMIDRVISQNRNFYSFQDFVKDILTDIVLDSLNRICFGGYGKDNSKVRAAISILSGQGRSEKDKGKENWVEPISSNTEAGVYIDRTDLGADQYIYKMFNINNTSQASPIFSKVKTNKAKEFSYLMFSAYSAGVLNSRLHGDKEEDADNGIAHFRYGSTTGMMKSVNFTKSPIEYLAEERYVREGSSNLLNQLAGRYEMEMSLVGNNMFIPGQYVYFDPVALGIGKSFANNASGRSLANLMGLGGYHLVTEVGNSISPGKFETTVKALWETGGTIPPDTEET